MKSGLAVALWLGALLLPAMADTRDQVAERLARCGGLTDSRQYLDCYYAAAQPLRTELGLQPAPQAAGFAPLFATPAPAPARSSVNADEGGGGLSGLAGAGSGLFSTLIGASTTKVPPEQFGLRDARPGPGVNVDRIVSPVASFQGHSGGFTVTLANGQVWEQLPGDDQTAHWSGEKKYTATVSYGAMGTFNLDVGERLLYKVRRVK